MAEDTTLKGQTAKALSELQALDTNGDVDIAKYVELHNRYGPDVQVEIRFATSVEILQSIKRLNQRIGETDRTMKKIRADVEAARLSAASAILMSALAIALVTGLDVVAAVAVASTSGIVAFFIQLALAALLYKREEA